MRGDEIAKRLDNRAGYELLTYREVALPVFGIHATALVQERQQRSCIEEFALRALAAGLGTAGQVQGILGLPERVVEVALADLVRQEAIRAVRGNELALTERGREILNSGEIVSPFEQTVWFSFDGLLRRPKWFGTTHLLRLNEVKEQGLLPIRAIPARAPEADEVVAADVSEVVRLAAGAGRGQKQVLRIQKIEKRQHLYVPAIALVYRAADGGGFQVGFAIDGRASQEHELAFARGGGVERQAIAEGLHRPPVAPADGPMAERVAEFVEAAGAIRKEAMRITSSRAAADRAAVARVTAQDEVARGNAERLETEARKEITKAEASLQQLLVRPVPVYDHPGILEDAFETARQRVLVISPWIRRAVVDDTFLRRVEQACRRGVLVSIGFGLGDADEGEKAWDAEARRKLEAIAKRESRLQVKRLGNTHAKVLIKDAEFFVITSFNWLSFRGDPSKAFRDEWGTMVRDHAVVEEYYQEMMKRFT